MASSVISRRLFFIIILIFSIFFSCTQREDIKIGFVAGLSGRRSQLGVSARNGVQLAIDHVNENGGINGRKVKLIIKDDKGDPETCGRMIGELVKEGVIGIIGPLLSNVATSAMTAIRGKDVLIISPTISTDALKSIDDNFLRVMPVSSIQAKGIADVILKDGIEKISIVYDSSNKAYTEPIYLLFKALIEKEGKMITYVNALEEDSGQRYLEIAKEIINSKPDALFIITSGIDAAFLCQQIRKSDKDIAFYGSYWVKTGNIIEEGGQSVEGMKIVVPFEREIKTVEYLRFKNDYLNKFKTSPEFVSMYAYEAAQVLFTGVKKSQDLHVASIKTSILKTKHFNGLKDDFTIDEYGDAIRSHMIVIIKNEKYEEITYETK